MKSIITSLLLLIFLYSCSDDTRYEERYPKYLITVDFTSGIVKEGGTVLISADQEAVKLCNIVKSGLPLPNGYNSNALCMGSDGKYANFIYLRLTGPSGSNIYLITFNESLTLVHKISEYHQTNCLNRWIISSGSQ